MTQKAVQEATQVKRRTVWSISVDLTDGEDVIDAGPKAKWEKLREALSICVSPPPKHVQYANQYAGQYQHSGPYQSPVPPQTGQTYVIVDQGSGTLWVTLIQAVLMVVLALYGLQTFYNIQQESREDEYNAHEVEEEEFDQTGVPLESYSYYQEHSVPTARAFSPRVTDSQSTLATIQNRMMSKPASRLKSASRSCNNSHCHPKPSHAFGSKLDKGDFRPPTLTSSADAGLKTGRVRPTRRQFHELSSQDIKELIKNCPNFDTLTIKTAASIRPRINQLIRESDESLATETARSHYPRPPISTLTARNSPFRPRIAAGFDEVTQSTQTSCLCNTAKGKSGRYESLESLISPEASVY
ncbi:unnamed protein product [Bursaphelenchus okinawaensis]|uniref:Uncharacterized protein n=1 Tax=Bursaphelenchus okinawaensis TaxID=465554 RepID=A0A811LKD9_9BILA|nr:unnamed protein product [Bursaphelenchus okinawaensis]CAG9124690.1 unnamed protein product [Bursaphelenchus okinawaensis]